MTQGVVDGTGLRPHPDVGYVDDEHIVGTHSRQLRSDKSDETRYRAILCRVAQLVELQATIDRMRVRIDHARHEEMAGGDRRHRHQTSRIGGHGEGV